MALRQVPFLAAYGGAMGDPRPKLLDGREITGGAGPLDQGLHPAYHAHCSWTAA